MNEQQSRLLQLTARAVIEILNRVSDGNEPGAISARLNLPRLSEALQIFEDSEFLPNE